MEKLFRYHYIVTIVNTVALLLIYAFVTPIRPLLFQEGWVVENLTALLCLASFVVGTVLTLKSRPQRPKRIYLVIPVLGLLSFLDEISFGENIFNLSMPVVYGVKLDALHDLIALGLNIANRTRWISVPFIIVCCVALIVLVYKNMQHAYRVRELINEHPPLRFLLICLGFGITALVLDTGIFRDKLSFLEELFELNASIALYFAAFSIRDGEG